MIHLVRDDKNVSSLGAESPFLRIAATGDQLTVAGGKVKATFPATVYEAGVIFIRTTVFRRLLNTFTDEKFLTLQIDKEGLRMGNVFVSFEVVDLMLFPNVEQAPHKWPAELPPSERNVIRDPQGNLFDR